MYVMDRKQQATCMLGQSWHARWPLPPAADVISCLWASALPRSCYLLQCTS